MYVVTYCTVFLDRVMLSESGGQETFRSITPDVDTVILVYSNVCNSIHCEKLYAEVLYNYASQQQKTLLISYTELFTHMNCTHILYILYI